MRMLSKTYGSVVYGVRNSMLAYIRFFFIQRGLIIAQNESIGVGYLREKVLANMRSMIGSSRRRREHLGPGSGGRRKKHINIRLNERGTVRSGVESHKRNHK